MDDYRQTIKRVVDTDVDSQGYRTVLADTPVDEGISKVGTGSIVEEVHPAMFLDYAHDHSSKRTFPESFTRSMVYNGPVGYYIQGDNQNNAQTATIFVDRIVNRGNHYVTVVSDVDKTEFNDSQALLDESNYQKRGLRQLNADSLLLQWSAVKRSNRKATSNVPYAGATYKKTKLPMFYFPQISTDKSSTDSSWQFAFLLRTAGHNNKGGSVERFPSYQLQMQNVSQKTAGNHNILKKGAACHPFGSDKTNIKKN